MLLIIDNFDSFTFNLVQAFYSCGVQAKVMRNSVPLNECLALEPLALVIGPGPGAPHGAGNSLDLLTALSKHGLPTLGVCLGHQAIAQSFGGTVIKASVPMHGKVSIIRHNGKDLFMGVAKELYATRYHSLLVDRSHFPGCLEICAETAAGEIMGLRHRELPIFGVQFHPESILTQEGWRLLYNFLLLSGWKSLKAKG